MPKHTPVYFDEQIFENDYKNRLKKFIQQHSFISSTAKAVLAIAILGGAITLSAVAPGIFSVIGKGIASKKNGQRERYRKLWRRFQDMKKQKIFEIQKENKDGSLTYKFTEKGRIISRKFLLDTLEIGKPKVWDRKWRIVIFDIPEKFKNARRAFQQKLKEIGFYPLQKSVWIYPFPCEPEINFLKDILNIYSFVEFFTTSELNNGRAIHHFQHLLKDFE